MNTESRGLLRQAEARTDSALEKIAKPGVSDILIVLAVLRRCHGLSATSSGSRGPALLTRSRFGIPGMGPYGLALAIYSFEDEDDAEALARRLNSCWTGDEIFVSETGPI